MGAQTALRSKILSPDRLNCNPGLEISQGRTPWLIQHVLTVLVFLSWVLLLPRPPSSFWSLRLFPWASILLHGPLDICLDLLPAAPLPRLQNRDAQHMFLQHRGTHRISVSIDNFNLDRKLHASRKSFGHRDLVPCRKAYGALRKGPAFHGSRSSRENIFRMQAVKWVVAKLQGDETASFCRERSGREVKGR